MMRLYVEVTNTWRSDLNTGISRVVRNVLRNLLELGPEKGIAVHPTILQGSSLVIVPPEAVLNNTSAERGVCGDRQRRAGWKKFKRRLSVGYGRVLDFAGFRSSIERLIAAEPKGTHVLLLLDASWPYEIWPSIEILKARGLRVVSVIYDLIPITHSHTVVESLVFAFEHWLQGQMRLTDSVVCISRSMADVVRKYLRERMLSDGLARSIPVSNFYLGAELDLANGTASVQERVVRLKSADESIFVMVGTIEPRKNHRHVFEAFKKLWAQGIDARLAIVGAGEWKSEELLAEIAAHPENGKRVFVFRDASDADLQWFYENATALIMASEVEGFGLPLVEARKAGLSVICSDILVFKELAARGTTFFRVGDVDDLVRVVVAHLAASHTSSRENGGGWITWRESSQQLLETVVRTMA